MSQRMKHRRCRERRMVLALVMMAIVVAEMLAVPT